MAQDFPTFGPKEHTRPANDARKTPTLHPCNLHDRMGARCDAVIIDDLNTHLGGENGGHRRETAVTNRSAQLLVAPLGRTPIPEERRRCHDR